MAERGRPSKEFDKETFEGLCEIQCTQSEICSVFRTTDKTLSKWCIEAYGENYSEVYKRFSEDGKKSLRRMQYDSARKGNVTMQIWLGKQYLGQRDKTEVTENVASNKLDSLLEQLDDSNSEA